MRTMIPDRIPLFQIISTLYSKKRLCITSGIRNMSESAGNQSGDTIFENG